MLGEKYIEPALKALILIHRVTILNRVALFGHFKVCYNVLNIKFFSP